MVRKNERGSKGGARTTTEKQHAVTAGRDLEDADRSLPVGCCAWTDNPQRKLKRTQKHAMSPRLRTGRVKNEETAHKGKKGGTVEEVTAEASAHRKTKEMHNRKLPWSDS